MSTNYSSRKTKVTFAKDFRDSFSRDTPKKVGYIFIGNSKEQPDENTAPEIFDTPETERFIWDTIIAGKKVVPGDVEFVIPLQRWTANTRYKQYDDTKTLDFLLSTSQAGDDTVYPMYVMNSEGNVYKCLCNNVSSFSQVEPTGTYSENNGFIQLEDEENQSCYLWKYMYTVKDSNKFLTDSWMPVPYVLDTQLNTTYDLNDENLVPGALAKIIVTNRGSGYYHSTINVASFAENTTELTVIDDVNLNDTYVTENMLVEGTGILEGTYITEINASLNKIFISEPTVGSGGGVSNTLSILTRVVISGDGSGTSTTVRLSDENGVEKIDVTSIGVDYTRANIEIFGSGEGAVARAVISPKLGHGYNPAIEFGANNVMIVQRIGEVDASEGGKIPTDTSFRRYGIIVNPYKYNENEPVSEQNAASVISQTTDVTLLSGAPYSLNEFVYQGPVDNPTFSGYVVSQDSDTVLLTDVDGQINIGSILYGQDSGRERPVVSIKYPDLEPYLGDVLYAKNVLKTDRSEGQAEEIKLIFQF